MLEPRSVAEHVLKVYMKSWVQFPAQRQKSNQNNNQFIFLLCGNNDINILVQLSLVHILYIHRKYTHFNGALSRLWYLYTVNALIILIIMSAFPTITKLDLPEFCQLWLH